MFKKGRETPPYNNGYYQQPFIERMSYQLEENNRKLRNLNNRIRRIENYLGLRIDDKFDDDLFSNDQF